VDSSIDLELSRLLTDGNLTHLLITRREWVRRRTEDVSFLSATKIVRKVKLEIDQTVLRLYLKEARRRSANFIHIPIALLPKTLTMSLNVRDSRGKGISVLPSNLDSRYALSAMLWALHRNGAPVKNLERSILEKLFKIASGMPSEADRYTLDRGSVGVVEAWSFPSDDDTVVATWESLFDDLDFYNLVSTYTTRYMPMVRLGLTADDDALELFYEYEESQSEAVSPTLQERMGAYTFGIIEAPAVGFAFSEHLNLAAPPGLFIERAALWEFRGNSRRYEDMVPTESSFTYDRRITPEQCGINTHDLDVGRYSVAFSMRLRRTGFLRRAAYTVFVSACILIAGGFVELFTRRLSQINSPKEAATALLLVVPTILLALIVGQDEHEILGIVLGYPRLLVASTAAANIAAAAVLVIGIHGRAFAFTWLGLGVIALLVLERLLSISRRSRFFERAVLQSASTTVESPVIVLMDQ
jgi:hypothetical protein